MDCLGVKGGASVRVDCEKGRRDCVRRHEVQMVDMRERKVRRPVLLAMLTVGLAMVPPIEAQRARRRRQKVVDRKLTMQGPSV